MQKIKINEIFYSLQGEGFNTGFPFIFVRTCGCSLNCSYCDTKYAKTSGKFLTVNDIINKIKKYSCKKVLITGGEPLEQPSVKYLIKELNSNKYKIFVETNGSHSLKDWPKNATYIIDIKCPSSGMNDFMNSNILSEIKTTDEIKFVISSNKDYNFAKNFYLTKLKNLHNIITFSPVENKISLNLLAKKILKDKLNVRLGIQLHKYIWPHITKGV